MPAGTMMTTSDGHDPCRPTSLRDHLIGRLGMTQLSERTASWSVSIEGAGRRRLPDQTLEELWLTLPPEYEIEPKN